MALTLQLQPAEHPASEYLPVHANGGRQIGALHVEHASTVVRAVNSHEQLLAACKQLLSIVDVCDQCIGKQMPMETDDVASHAIAAIAAAEGRA
jgi:hypothetical protein